MGVVLLLVAAVAGGGVGAGGRFAQSAFEAGASGRPAGWTVWSARPETAPRAGVDPAVSRGGPGSLALSGAGAPAFGGWERLVGGVEPGRWLRLVAHHRSAGLALEPLQVVARLDWRDARGARAGQPDYAWREAGEGEWTRLLLEAPAPAGASAVAVQLFVSHLASGTVWWDDVSLEPIPAPPPRPVRVATVKLRPRDTGSPEESVRRFVEAVDAELAPGTADVILLPEGATVVGTGKTYVEVAEAVPGPTTARLGDLARRHRSWVVAGLYEREGALVYNTAVLLDRAGRLAGRYRKVYLPREEMEGGLTAGGSYPVFDTDFGRVGLMICWDVQYADPARALALGGAELVLMPIWGGSELLARARAAENRFFLASSGYDFPTMVVDPDGEVLARAAEGRRLVLATVDLARRDTDPWLGERRGRLFRELRLDVPVEPPASPRPLIQ
jgi:predicted amidohydrolase